MIYLLFFLALGMSNFTEAHVTTVNPDTFKWGSTPYLPKEIKAAVLLGNPAKNDALVLRLKFPAGSRIAPHWHPVNENVTVISGTLHLGEGDRFDASKGVAITKGGFASIPAKHHHFAWANEETEVQLNNFGQWDIIYVNSKDDPRNQ